ncbi:MAG: tyrosine-type recombinase/integrase [Thermoplasmata archaeon]|nr:tyrosine-type recombinase/integrase [Thermoplasmata archaeon]
MVTKNEKLIESQLSKLKKKNKEVLGRFVTKLRGDNAAEGTQVNYVVALTKLGRYLDGRKLTFEDLKDKGMLEKFFAKRSKEVCGRVLNLQKRQIKRFYNWLDKPEVTEGIEINSKDDTLRLKLKSTDMLTEEEVMALIDCASTVKRKALVAMLWDSGARIGELLSIQLKDVNPHRSYPKAFHVVIRKSKTEEGERELALFFTYPYLVRWLNEHPLKDDLDAPLFISESNQNFGQPLKADGARKVIEVAANRAKKIGKIPKDKRVYPHLFRHSRTTDLLSKGYHPTKLKSRQGWTSMKMVDRYEHLSPKVHQEEDARMYGATEERSNESMKPSQCRFCHHVNPPNFKFCGGCGTPLDADKIPIFLPPELISKIDKVLKTLEAE